jgi:N-acetylglucosamine kinase
MTDKDLVLGIDGGGTSTVCLIADGQGNVLAHAEGPASNHRKVDLLEARAALIEGIRVAHAQTGQLWVDRPRFAAVCAGLAGVDTTQDAALLRNLLNNIVATEHLQVLNDGEIALAGALEDDAGVLAISGTGSIAWAAAKDGSHVRVGGWDYILGDEGSGYNIGSRVLRAVAAAHDGRCATTSLTGSVFAFFDVPDFDRLLGVIYHEEMTPQRIASLAPLADKAAMDGDAAAVQLIGQAACDLAALTLSAARIAHLDSDPFPVVAMGGVLLADGFFAHRFREAVRDAAPKARFVSSRHPPAEGAVRLALRSIEHGLRKEARSSPVTSR